MKETKIEINGSCEIIAYEWEHIDNEVEIVYASVGRYAEEFIVDVDKEQAISIIKLLKDTFNLEIA